MAAMSDGAGIPPGRTPGTHPARSRMLDAFAADVASMLTEGHFDNAEKSALAIPHIAVALSDAALQSTHAAYRNWCSHWVQPDFGETVYARWAIQSSECARESGDVPFAALRTLRLQRRLRTTPTTFARQSDQSAESNTARAVTCALLGAVFRWYEQEGRYLSIVQTHLARLGVLR